MLKMSSGIGGCGARALGAALVLGVLAGSVSDSALALTGGPDAGGYSFKDTASGGPALNFEALPAPTTPASANVDDGFQIVPIGFNFTYYGVVYSNVAIHSNGYISISSDTNVFLSGVPCPNTGVPNGIVAGYWEDLLPSGTMIQYQTLGSSPTRRFVVRYLNVPHFGSGNLVNMEFKLFEGTNVIEVHYGVVQSDGGNHIAGIENAAGSIGLNYLNSVLPPTNNQAVSYSLPVAPAASDATIEAKLDDGTRWVSDSELATSQTSQNTTINTSIANAQTNINASTNTAVTNAQTNINSNTNTAVTNAVTNINANTNTAIANAQTAINTATSTAITNAASGLNTKLSALEVKLDDGTRFTSDAERSAQTTAINTSISAVNTSIANAQTNINANTSTVVNGAVTTLVNEVNQNQVDIARIEAKLDSAGGLGTKLDALEVKLDDEARFTSDAEFQVAVNGVAALESKLDDGTRFTSDAERAAQTSVLDAAIATRASQASVDALDTEIDALDAEIDAIDAAVDSVEAKLDDGTRFTSDAERAAQTATLQADIATRASQASVDTLDVEVDSIEAKLDARLDVAISSRASTVDVADIKAVIAAVEAKLDSSATTDAIAALEAKADSAATVEADADLENLRIHIEEALLRDDHLAHYYLPEEQGGRLQLVHDIVEDTIARHQVLGLPIGHAPDFLVEGEAEQADQDYKDAFDSYRKAYRACVQGG